MRQSGSAIGMVLGVLASATLLVAACQTPPAPVVTPQAQQAQPKPARPVQIPGQNAAQAKPDAQADPREIERGRLVAQLACAGCHAIDRTSASPKKDAPPLRDILHMYPSEMLAERFIEGVRVGHDEMPRFDFDVRVADALIAYLKSITSEETDGKPVSTTSLARPGVDPAQGLHAASR